MNACLQHRPHILLTIMFGWLWSPHTPLSDEQARMYASEKMENFRWASRVFGTHSSHTLTSTDLAPIELQEELTEIGQFAELAHGHLSPEFVWNHMDILQQPGFPLDGYDALPSSRLHSAFHGTVCNLQGYVAYRAERKQLVLAFSGTSSLSQSLHNLDALLIRYPHGSGCAVHAGFWKMYNGVRTVALKQLAKAQLDCEVEEMVFTGHSLGAVMCCLLALDVMTDDFNAESIPRPPTPLPLKLVLFGCPRFGNPALAQYWEHTVSSYQRRHGEPSVNEFSVRVLNDGAPTLPPQFLGYRHAVKTVFYFAHSTLYSIPPSESEYTIFKVDDLDTKTQKTHLIKHPKGGHLYYNDRNMELLLRRIHWIQVDVSISGEADWVERYQANAGAASHPI